MTGRKLLIVGATGHTGLQLLRQALDAGHEVTAFVRNPAKLSVDAGRVRLAVGDVTDPQSGLTQAAQGQDVVISALGRGLSFKSEQLIQRSVPLLLSAMQSAGVRRLIFTSAIGVGETAPEVRLPLVSRLMIMLPLRDIYADKAIGEALIRRSDLDWTIVQPTQLTNGQLTATYRAGERLALRGVPTISRADVAHFIVSQVDQPDYIRKAVIISR
jgi:putative NADH-flavin reductase